MKNEYELPALWWANPWGVAKHMCYEANRQAALKEEQNKRAVDAENDLTSCINHQNKCTHRLSETFHGPCGQTMFSKVEAACKHHEFTVARAEKAEKELDIANKNHDEGHATYCKVVAERDALKAKLEEAEKIKKEIIAEGLDWMNKYAKAAEALRKRKAKKKGGSR